jgi:hypothetical protein
LRIWKAGVTNLKTNEPLLKALKKAAARVHTAEELHKQRVSFILGLLKSSSEVTRDRVEEVLTEQEGRKTGK